MKLRLVVWIAIAMVLLCQSNDALAQVTFGVFRGVVTDPSGAPIPGASVTAISKERGFTKTVLSDAQGNYEIPSLLEGTYVLTAEATGFRKYVHEELVLYSRDMRRVDITLEVGPVTEEVTVSAVAPVIETEGAEVAITRPEAWQIFRPGLRQEGGQPLWELFRAGQQGHFAIGGGGASFVWINHGAHGNEMRSSHDGMAAEGSFRVPQFAVRETKLHLVNSPAEFQTSGTAQAITRGGTNEFHGVVLLQVENGRLNALGPNTTVRPPGVPAVEWEISAGGPAVIPKIYNGRNRTFFNFVARPVSNAQIANYLYVYPHPRMRSGDLSVYSKPVIDPTTGEPFLGNQIPASRISPVSKKLMDLYFPLPNRGDENNLSDNYTTPLWSHTKQRDYVVRVDHQLTQANRATVIVHRLWNRGTGDFDVNPTDGGYDHQRGRKSIAFQDSHTFSSSVVNEFGFSRLNIYRHDFIGNISGRAFLESIGLTNLGGRTVPDSLGAPRVTLPGFGDIRRGGDSVLGRSQGIIDQNDIRYSVRDNVLFQKGRHVFKTGFSLTRYVPNNLAVGGNSWGSYVFNGFATGNIFGDFLLGIPQSTAISRPRSILEERHSEIGFFFQDDFKVHPRLTLNLGLRYQVFTVPTDVNGLFYNFDPFKKQLIVRDEAAKSAVHPAYPKEIPIVTASEAGYPDSLVKDPKWSGWEPRIGVAWRPWGNKFVVRSGWGLYHVPTTTGFALAGRESGPFQLNESFGPTQIVNGVPTATFSNPFPSEPGRVGAQSLIGLPTNYMIPYTMQWNLTLERSLGQGFAGRISYVGSKGTQWRYLRELTQPFPSTNPYNPSTRPFQPYTVYNSVKLAQNGGNMTYHALELEVTRKFAPGLFFQSNFNWTKTLLDVFEGSQENGLTPTDSYNRALDKGQADASEPILFSTNVVWELPFGRGRRFLNFPSGRGYSVLNHIFGGWTISGLMVASAGYIFTPSYSGFDSTGTGIRSGRPDAIRQDNQEQRDATHWWCPECYAIPSTTGDSTGQPLGRFGNAAKGSLRGPGYYLVDSGIYKDFPLYSREQFSPRLRLAFLARNSFNHPAQGGLFGCNTDVTSPAFGTCPKGSTPPYWPGFRQVWLTAQIVF